MSTKNVLQVMQEIGENCGIDRKSAINDALLNKLCTTKSPQIQERIVKRLWWERCCDAKYRPPRQFR